MRLWTSLLAFAVALASAKDLVRCRTPKPPTAAILQEVSEAPLAARTIFGPRKFVINTYVHVITTKAKQGRYPRSMVEEQIRVMNKAYAGSRFSFNTKNITFTVNDSWATALDGPLELEYKKALRQGTYQDLNLFFLSDLGGGLLGFCYLPVGREELDDELRILDSCTNLAGSMPGGEAVPYDLGATAIHETGHWLGLLHTFEGESCSGKGDYVADTPREIAPNFGCPRDNRPDTCPKSPGLDPIFNYMDYSTDICMDQFTPLQSIRMLSMYTKYRLFR